MPTALCSCFSELVVFSRIHWPVLCRLNKDKQLIIIRLIWLAVTLYENFGNYQAVFCVAGACIFFAGLLGYSLSCIHRWEENKRTQNAKEKQSKYHVANPARDVLAKGSIHANSTNVSRGWMKHSEKINPPKNIKFLWSEKFYIYIY